VATGSTLRDESTLAELQFRAASGFHLLVMGPKVFATYPLPPGKVVVGRGGIGVDVKLDDAKASRRHLRLHVRDQVEIEDLDSANGTRVRERKLLPGARVPVLPGEAISVGSLLLMVQPRRWARAQRDWQPLSHADFTGRVDWECARADAVRGRFSVVCIPAPQDATLLNAGYQAILSIEVVGRDQAGGLELLLPELAGELAVTVATAFAQPLGGNAGPPQVGVATYPEDGRNAAALIARASARAQGRIDPMDDVRPDAYDATPIACVDPRMVGVNALAERTAAGDISVLLLGESGVGKDVVARAIHAASARAARPLVAINCGALSETLLESELFGYERGAFTDAAHAKPGLLETANGSTVFLDEIGELPLVVQAKLLRVIEQREVYRLGALRPRKIDMRFIAATTRDLEAEVARGQFRRDLFFRLNGVTLTVPPLRERPADIPILARAFLDRMARNLPKRPGSPPEISEAAMTALRAYSWPGNVRDLRNVIEGALLICDGPVLLPDHLPERVTHPSNAAEPTEAPAPPSAAGAPIDDERARILAALAACAGNQSRAARQLGISRKVLIARLDSYGVARPRKPGAR